MKNPTPLLKAMRVTANVSKRYKAGFLCAIFFATALWGAPQSQAATRFFIDSAYDNAGRVEAQALLELTSEHAYWFVEQNFFMQLAPSDAQRLSENIGVLAGEFDARIYPLLRQAYGSEWLPGIDNDARVTILFLPMRAGVGGYMRLSDTNPQSNDAFSNAREMIYVNTEYLSNGKAKTIAAHEFAHLIAYNERDRLRGAQDSLWFEESLAEYAPTVLGYNDVWEGSDMRERAREFQNLPFDSLLEWTGISADSSSAFLFMHYLAGRYGGAFPGEVMRSSASGTAAITEALQKMGYQKTFEDVFRDWAIANFVNGTANVMQDGSTTREEFAYRYMHAQLDYSRLHAPPLFTASVFPNGETPFTLAVKDWEARWYKFVPGELGNTGKNILRVVFETNDPQANFIVPYVVGDIAGARSVAFLRIASGRGVAYIPSFGVSALSVALAPINMVTRENEQFFNTVLTFRASLVSDIPIDNFSRPDGALIRARGDKKVYVLTAGYKRWIQSPAIMDMYGHFRWSDIVEVSPEERDSYPESFLVRKEGDHRVYEITSSGRKKWLNITPAQFTASGRKWDAIFIVNGRELSWYRQ